MNQTTVRGLMADQSAQTDGPSFFTRVEVLAFSSPVETTDEASTGAAYKETALMRADGLFGGPFGSVRQTFRGVFHKAWVAAGKHSLVLAGVAWLGSKKVASEGLDNMGSDDSASEGAIDIGWGEAAEPA